MRTTVLIALILLAAPRVYAGSENDSLRVRLRRSVAGYALSADSLASAVAGLSIHFHIPMGVEWIRGKESLKRVHLSWKTATVAAIVSDVVRTYPGYEWRVEDGVVHVFRRDFVDSRHNFLNLRVPANFQVRSEAGGLIKAELQQTVQDIVSPHKLPPGAGVGGSYATGVSEKPLTVTLVGLTLRQAMDRLVARSEHKIWIVTFSPSVALTPTGFRLTETLWHPTPFVASEQPTWDFFTWSQYRTFRKHAGVQVNTHS